MSLTRVITDIPQDRVNFVIALIHDDGGSFTQESEPDGKVTIIATFRALPQPAPQVAALGSPQFKWMTIARNELGQHEGGGGGGNPRIVAYHTTTHGGAAPDSVPWCSSFVNFCVEQAGFHGTDSKLARSWLDWGIEAPDFLPGCIVVLKRGDPPKGHVGFYVGRESGRLMILGGNQGQQVSIASYDADRVIGRRILP